MEQRIVDKLVQERDSKVWLRANGLLRYAMVHLLADKVPLYTVNEFPKSGGSWMGQMLSAALSVPFPRNRLPTWGSAIMHGHYLNGWGMKNVVVVWRDGRDVLVSLYYHALFPRPNGHNGRLVAVTRRALGELNYEDIKSNLPRFMEYTFTRCVSPRFSWPEFVDAWLPKKDAVHVKYEHLLSRGEQELRRIVADLTGRDLDEPTAAEIVTRYSFESQSGRKPGEADNKSFLRKGIAGDWRNHFSREAREVFHHYAGRALTELGYEKDRAWVRESAPPKVSQT